MVDIKKTIMEIIVSVLVVIISIPIWNRLGENHKLIYTYSNISVVLDFNGFDLLTNSDENNYKTLKPTNVSIRNVTDNNKNYKLYYTYSKKSTIDYDTLFISLDDKIYSLKDINYIEDSDYYYFLLESNDIDSYTTLNKDSRIWTKADDGSLAGTFIIM